MTIEQRLERLESLANPERIICVVHDVDGSIFNATAQKNLTQGEYEALLQEDKSNAKMILVEIRIKEIP